MKAFGLFAFALCFSSHAMASVYVKCGDSVDPDTMEAKGYVLEVSSEDDAFSGAVGGSWNLKLDENGDWLAKTSKVTARTSENVNVTTVEIRIANGQSASGPVGTIYKLVDIYSDMPTLEKYTMGGFVGTAQVGSYKCVSGND